MNQNFRTAALGAALGFGLIAANANAASVELQQTGQLHSGSYLDTYYIGGYAGNTFTSGPLTGQSQYGAGPNVGFTFSSNALVESAGTSGANDGKFENLPSDPVGGNTQVLSFSGLGGSATDTINFAQGFTGLSFNYSLGTNNPAYAQTADIWSGLNGAGSLVGTISLTASATPKACSSMQDAFCSWSAGSANSLSGVGESITFGVASTVPSENLELDAVTVSAATVPLPAASWLLLGGLAGLGGIARRRRVQS